MKNWKALLWRSLREGSLQLWRNRFLSGTTILLGALILFLLNFVFSLQFFADFSLKDLQSRADFSVVLKSDFDAFDFEALKNEIRMFETEVQILPAEQFEDFEAPPRLHIRFLNLREVGSIFEVLKKPRYSTVVGEWDTTGERDFVTLIERLTQMRDSVHNAGLWFIFLFLGGGILLTLNTFRLMLFSRREEIFIARLVGADPEFIAGPFLIEGLLLGLASSMIGIFLFIFVLRQIDVLPGGAIFLHLWNNIFGTEILAAGLVGIVGASISVKRYLRGKFGF